MRDPYQSALRTAIVTTSYPRSRGDWVGHFVRAEARALADDGSRVTVLAPGRVFSSADEHIDVRALGGGAAFGPPGAMHRIASFPPRVIAAAEFAVRARSELLRNRYDRVIAHWALPCAWPIARGLAVEVVSHGADVRLLAQLPSAMRHHIVRCITRDATSWRFVSQSLADALLAALPRSLAREIEAIIRIEAWPVSVPEVRARARALRSTLGPFWISVGRLVPKKRVTRAIDAAADHGRRLVIVGDGPERRSLERHASNRNADVHFVGALEHSEALAHLAASDALLFASEEEGCSTVLREAEALGVLVVSL